MKQNQPTNQQGAPGVLSNIPIIGKKGKAPQNTDQVDKERIDKLEGMVKDLLAFSIEKGYKTNELVLALDMFQKKMNGFYSQKIEAFNKDFGDQVVSEDVNEVKLTITHKPPQD